MELRDRELEVVALVVVDQNLEATVLERALYLFSLDQLLGVGEVQEHLHVLLPRLVESVLGNCLVGTILSCEDCLSCSLRFCPQSPSIILLTDQEWLDMPVGVDVDFNVDEDVISVFEVTSDQIAHIFDGLTCESVGDFADTVQLIAIVLLLESVYHLLHKVDNRGRGVVGYLESLSDLALALAVLGH